MKRLKRFNKKPVKRAMTRAEALIKARELYPDQAAELLTKNYQMTDGSVIPMFYLFVGDVIRGIGQKWEQVLEVYPDKVRVHGVA